MASRRAGVGDAESATDVAARVKRAVSLCAVSALAMVVLARRRPSPRARNQSGLVPGWATKSMSAARSAAGAEAA